MPNKTIEEKRRYPQELSLMNDCPECGQTVNREFVEAVIDEITGLEYKRGYEAGYKEGRESRQEEIDRLREEAYGDKLLPTNKQN